MWRAGVNRILLFFFLLSVLFVLSVTNFKSVHSSLLTILLVIYFCFAPFGHIRRIMLFTNNSITFVQYSSALFHLTTNQPARTFDTPVPIHLPLRSKSITITIHCFRFVPCSGQSTGL
uniref:Uncharacterized protein n=1 Tax=Anopheles darlingi TaxID=43151 RepID=A0A2M4DH29_ANODA